MKIVFLGTGTSMGVPIILCSCPVCRSRDPRNRRRRSSLYVAAAGRHIVVDTPPDFRQQVLEFKVRRLDALLFTHSHADHVCGFDDIRRFNQAQGRPVPLYGPADTLRDIARMFPHALRRPAPGVSYPRVRMKPVSGPFRIGPVCIEPIPVEHAELPTVGYRFEVESRVAVYVPDCSGMSESALARIRGCDLMILDALKEEDHPTHLKLADSIAWLRRIGAKRSFITHLSHRLDHDRTQAKLPSGMFVPYDGLSVRV